MNGATSAAMGKTEGLESQQRSRKIYKAELQKYRVLVLAIATAYLPESTAPAPNGDSEATTKAERGVLVGAAWPLTVTKQEIPAIGLDQVEDFEKKFRELPCVKDSGIGQALLSLSCLKVGVVAFDDVVLDSRE